MRRGLEEVSIEFVDERREAERAKHLAELVEDPLSLRAISVPPAGPSATLQPTRKDGSVMGVVHTLIWDDDLRVSRDRVREAYVDFAYAYLTRSE